MFSMTSVPRLAVRAAIAMLALAASACSLNDQKAPSLTGPSEFGLSVTMTASPDQLPRDGTSQSIVTVTVRDAQSHAVAGQRITVSLPANAPAGASLSQSEVVTGSGGQATFAVTAPVSGSLGNIIITAIPIGTNASNAAARVISITATPTNSSVPTATFTFTPASPEVGQIVTFDATGTRDENSLCTNCNFAWNFGGEGTASGAIVKHAFTAGGTFVVVLTATDAGGSVGVTQQNVVVTAPGPATVSFTVSPLVPIASQTATFDASQSRPANNHRIVSYTWNWGDGSSDQSTVAATIQHVFSNSGRFPVTLTVKDDLNQSATVTNAVDVSSGLNPVLTASPSGSAVIGQTIFFDASGSTSSTGSKIVTYLFDFGDGTSQSSSFSTAKHEYAAAGTFTVKLTITDDKGRTASTTTVGAGAGAGNITITN